jgi:Protein of unknown function (DUF1569)
MKPARRTLTFDSLDRVMPDVDRLLAGHTTVGEWSLGQICNHLTTTLTWTVEGYPKLAPWFVRQTVGPLVLRHILKTGRFPDGIKLPQTYLPNPDLDERAEAEALRAALWHFAGHSGPLSDHPMAGQIARADWERFHCIHCARHLSFALPGQ